MRHKKREREQVHFSVHWKDRSRMRLDNDQNAAHHSAIDSLSGELAILKKDLGLKRVSPEAAEDLDAFYKQQEKAWEAVITKIMQLLEG